MPSSTKPKRTAFKPDHLNWCELDLIGTFLIDNRTSFIEHITKFGYTKPEANIRVGHIANKIFNAMSNVDPQTNKSRHFSSP
jgi:hypothetical protein